MSIKKTSKISFAWQQANRIILFSNIEVDDTHTRNIEKVENSKFD